MMQLPMDWDVCEGKHGGNPQSAAVNPAQPVKLKSQHAILTILRERGPMTSKELCRAMGKYPNEISGRLTELKRLGLIRPTGVTREDCAELAHFRPLPRAVEGQQ